MEIVYRFSGMMNTTIEQQLMVIFSFHEFVSRIAFFHVFFHTASDKSAIDFVNDQVMLGVVDMERIESFTLAREDGTLIGVLKRIPGYNKTFCKVGIVLHFA
jgi:hypothetical protein